VTQLTIEDCFPRSQFVFRPAKGYFSLSVLALQILILHWERAEISSSIKIQKNPNSLRAVGKRVE
jgi:hypothetical protein